MARWPDHPITRDHPGSPDRANFASRGGHPITRSFDIVRYYTALYSHWGPQNWWPALTRLEVIVGAYLTQNTSWSNVEKAIANLRRARVLSVPGLRSIPLRRLATLVRPSGYFRQKARKLKTFIRFLDRNYAGSLDRMFAQPTDKLRVQLLELNGVGPETADSILLYAGNHPVFVVDAYTRRVFERHQIIPARSKYEEMRSLVERALKAASPDSLRAELSAADSSHHRPRHPISRVSRMARSELTQHYNELHALIVRDGNEYCRATPRCEECPLRGFLPSPSKAPSSSEGSL
jgi:endonuclease III related protein